MRNTTHNDDDWDDDEGVEDWDQDNEQETYPCPYCGKEVYEDAERCPRCEKYISGEDATTTRKPWWFVVALVLALTMLLGWVLRF
jgi:hypothetical protein